MEIRITYDDGRTFATQIPNGNIASVTMCLINQHYVKIGNFDAPRCDEPQDKFTYEDAVRGRRTPV